MRAHILLIGLFLIGLNCLGQAQQINPLFPASEIWDANGQMILGLNSGDIASDDEYLLFGTPLNSSTGMVLIYHKDPTTLQYSEVNRVYGSPYYGAAVAANGNWFMTYNGGDLQFTFFQLDANHQIVNSVLFGRTNIYTYASNAHLLPNNNLVVNSYGSGRKLELFQFANNNWATTASDSVPSEFFSSVNNYGAAVYNKSQNLVLIYDISGSTFDLTDNISIPFNIAAPVQAYAYDGSDTIVFAVNFTQVDILEKINGEWIHKTAVWNVTGTSNQYKFYIKFIGDGFYINAIEYDYPQMLQGRIFKFERSDEGVWTNTKVYVPPSKLIDEDKYMTRGTVGFAVTDVAVFSLAAAHYINSNPRGAMQLLYTPHCYDEPIDLVCEQMTYLSCDPFNITVHELFSVNNPECGPYELTSHYETESNLEVMYENDQYSISISVSRFNLTAECQSVIRCGIVPIAEPIAEPNSPNGSNSPDRVNSPSNQVSASALVTASSLLIGFFTVITM